jgi:hypothetical protein
MLFSCIGFLQGERFVGFIRFRSDMVSVRHILFYGSRVQGDESSVSV